MRALITLPLQGNETHIASGSAPGHPAAIASLADNHATIDRVGHRVRQGLLAEVIAQSGHPSDGVGRAVSA